MWRPRSTFLLRNTATSFNSLYDTFIAGPTGEVLGPAGLSAADGRVLVIVSESVDGVHTVSPGLAIPRIGNLFSLNRGNGKATDRGDIGHQEYAWAGEHQDLWEEFPDSNPKDVLVTKNEGRSRTFVIDAGANTVSEVMPNGTIRVIAFIPNDPVRGSGTSPLRTCGSRCAESPARSTRSQVSRST